MKNNFLHLAILSWGLFWGVLALSLFFVGVLGLFYRPMVIGLGIFLLLIAILILRKQRFPFEAKNFFKNIVEVLRQDWISALILVGFLFFAIFNFLLTLSPEVGFDALWYHLTLPKIWLETHEIAYMPGGLFYYSVMPRLGELIYGFVLAIAPSGFWPKIIHYFFGLFWFVSAYLLSRQFLSRRGALVAALAAYATYLVSWLSMTAYIDLIVAYYAATAMWLTFRYLAAKKLWDINLAAIFVGFLLAGKLYGLFLFVILFFILFCKNSWRAAGRFALIALLIPLPFYLQAYFATGNPIYPVFSVQDSALRMYLSGYTSVKEWYLNFWWKNLPSFFWEAIIYRFTPVFGLVFLIFLANKWRKMLISLVIFSVFFICWSLVPVQESRYFLVIVPLLSCLAIYTIENISWKPFKGLGIMLLLVGLTYNVSFSWSKFKESFEEVFGKNPTANYVQARLVSPLNFYDFSGNFGREIKDKKALTVNTHNLFCADFSFVDWSVVESQFSDKSSASIFSKNLKNAGFDYVLLGQNDKIAGLSDWLKLPQEELDKSFTPVLNENNFTLYKIFY